MVEKIGHRLIQTCLDKEKNRPYNKNNKDRFIRTLGIDGKKKPPRSREKAVLLKGFWRFWRLSGRPRAAAARSRASLRR